MKNDLVMDIIMFVAFVGTFILLGWIGLKVWF